MTGEQREVDLIHEAANKISAQRDTDVLFFCGLIDDHTCFRLRSKVRHRRSRATNALVMLTTFGGLADPAYRISRCLQEAYKTHTIFIHEFCKSAGTLAALGADELVMSELAECGPLDVQILQRDVQERTSGLTPTQALTTLRHEVFKTFQSVYLSMRREIMLTTEAASQSASQITAELYSSVYAKLDLVRLGENDRAMAVAKEYGTRLSRNRNLVTSEGINKLIESYPSHEFVIDKREAQEIFRNLRAPSELEQDLADKLSDLVNQLLRNDDYLVDYVNTLPGDENDGPEPATDQPKPTEPKETEQIDSTDETSEVEQAPIAERGGENHADQPQTE